MLSSFNFVVNALSGQRRITVTVVVAFMAGIVLALLIPASLKSQTLDSLGGKFESFSENHWLLLWQIFFNNFRTALTVLVLGFTIVIPYGIAFFNGVSLGVVAELAARIARLDPSISGIAIASIITHGVLEIPVFLASTSLGVITGIKILHPEKVAAQISRQEFFRRALVAYFVIITPLLFLASVIETFITPVVTTLVSERMLARQPEGLPPELIVGEEDLARAGMPGARLGTDLEEGVNTGAWESIGFVGKLLYDDTVLTGASVVAGSPWASASYTSDAAQVSIFIAKPETEHSIIDEAFNKGIEIIGDTASGVEFDSGIYSIHGDRELHIMADWEEEYFFIVIVNKGERELLDSIFDIQRARF